MSIETSGDGALGIKLPAAAVIVFGRAMLHDWRATQQGNAIPQVHDLVGGSL